MNEQIDAALTDLVVLVVVVVELKCFAETI